MERFREMGNPTPDTKLPIDLPNETNILEKKDPTLSFINEELQQVAESTKQPGESLRSFAQRIISEYIQQQKFEAELHEAELHEAVAKALQQAEEETKTSYSSDTIYDLTEQLSDADFADPQAAIERELGTVDIGRMIEDVLREERINGQPDRNSREKSMKSAA